MGCPFEEAEALGLSLPEGANFHSASESWRASAVPLRLQDYRESA